METQPTPILRRPAPKKNTANEYCNKCRMTTTHDIKGDQLVCPRCNVVKTRGVGQLYRGSINPAPKFEDKLKIALGLLESKDKPEKVKIEGDSKKTASGAHRFDDGVKFIQMKADDQFKTKDDAYTLR